LIVFAFIAFLRRFVSVCAIRPTVKAGEDHCSHARGVTLALAFNVGVAEATTRGAVKEIVDSRLFAITRGKGNRLVEPVANVQRLAFLLTDWPHCESILPAVQLLA